jgi:sphingomyelin phosphodiesterase acid-like 3
VSVIFLGPAVTPWRSSIQAIGSNNPSIRLYQYDRQSGQIQDIHQYYLNLTLANTQPTPTWQLEYKLTEAFDMKNATPQSFQQLLQKFKKPRSKEFQKFFVYNSVGVDISICNDTYKSIFMCSLKNVGYSDYHRCLKERPIPLRHVGLTIFAGVLALIVLVIVALMLYYCTRPRPPRGYYGFSNA